MEREIRPSVPGVGAHLIHNINKELGGRFGEVIGQSAPVRLVRGDLFNSGNDFIRNQGPVGLYIYVGADG